MLRSTALFWATLVSAVVFPSLALALCASILVVQCAVLLVRSGSAAIANRPSELNQTVIRPVFSVHVATYNEPPDVVIDTLEALSRQTWPASRFEVIVIDNNTADRQLWEPVYEACRRLGGNISFIHRMGVIGAKAGALNIAFASTRSDATHIVTVDADYQVSEDFLDEAARALQETGAAYVQFPQAYRHTRKVALGVDCELEEYFRADARMADGAEAVLLTGTLCVISCDALKAVGGWSGRTTTEDAELGVRLCRAGFNGRYIHKVKGRGLLPLNLRDLGKQRYRWSSGNFRTLLQHIGAILGRRGHLETRKRLAIISQLCAWLNFSLIPVAVLLASPLMGPSGGRVAAVASLSVVFCLVDIVVRLGGRAWRDGIAPKRALAAIATRLALAPVSARATLDACLGGKLKFDVTRKAIDRGGDTNFPTEHTVIFVLALIALPTSVAADPLVTVGLVSLLLPLPAALMVERGLTAYRNCITVQ